jgi:hypothetical protein
MVLEFSCQQCGEWHDIESLLGKKHWKKETQYCSPLLRTTGEVVCFDNMLICGTSVIKLSKHLSGHGLLFLSDHKSGEFKCVSIEDESRFRRLWKALSESGKRLEKIS